MRYRDFSGAQVSEISFGAWVLSGMYGRIDEEDARRLVKTAIDLGINLFDVADVYGKGLAERRLGELLRGYDVHVTTKVGYDVSGQKFTRRYDAEFIEKAIKESLGRLGRRPLAVLMHNPTADDVRRYYRVFRGLVLRFADHAGVALGPETDVLEQGMASIDEGAEVIMLVFNALEQEPALTLINRAVGRVVMARVPHATGALTDNPQFTFSVDDHRSLRDTKWLKAAVRIVDEYVRPLARELGLSLSQYALKYVLSYPITTVVVTATRPEELREFVEASDGKSLPRDHLERLREAYERLSAIMKG